MWSPSETVLHDSTTDGCGGGGKERRQRSFVRNAQFGQLDLFRSTSVRKAMDTNGVSPNTDRKQQQQKNYKRRGALRQPPTFLLKTIHSSLSFNYRPQDSSVHLRSHPLFSRLIHLTLFFPIFSYISTRFAACAVYFCCLFQEIFPSRIETKSRIPKNPVFCPLFQDKDYHVGYRPRVCN